MVAAYPMGPVMEGVGLNITVISYRGSVDFGFMVDRELVPDVWDMADRVKDALAELQEAAALLADGPTTAPEIVAERRDAAAGWPIRRRRSRRRPTRPRCAPTSAEPRRPPDLTVRQENENVFSFGW